MNASPSKDEKREEHIDSLTQQISTYLEKAVFETLEYLEESIILPISSIDGVSTNTKMIVEHIRDNIDDDEEYTREQYSMILSLSLKPSNITCRCQGYYNECSLEFSGITKAYMSEKFRPQDEKVIYTHVKKCVEALKDLEYAPSSVTFFSKKEHKERNLKTIRSWIQDFSKVSTIGISFQECCVCYVPTRVRTRCNHNICLKCTDKLCKHLQNNSFSCPMCRAQSYITCDNVI